MHGINITTIYNHFSIIATYQKDTHLAKEIEARKTTITENIKALQDSLAKNNIPKINLNPKQIEQEMSDKFNKDWRRDLQDPPKDIATLTAELEAAAQEKKTAEQNPTNQNQPNTPNSPNDNALNKANIKAAKAFKICCDLLIELLEQQEKDIADSQKVKSTIGNITTFSQNLQKAINNAIKLVEGKLKDEKWKKQWDPENQQPQVLNDGVYSKLESKYYELYENQAFGIKKVQTQYWEVEMVAENKVRNLKKRIIDAINEYREHSEQNNWWYDAIKKNPALSLTKNIDNISGKEAIIKLFAELKLEKESLEWKNALKSRKLDGNVERKKSLRFAVASLASITIGWQFFIAATFILVATLQIPARGLTGKHLTSSSIFTLAPWAWILPIIGWIVSMLTENIVTCDLINGIVAIVFWSILIRFAWKKRYQSKAKPKKYPVKNSKEKSTTHKETATIFGIISTISMVYLLITAWALGRGSELISRSTLAYLLASIAIMSMKKHKHPIAISSITILLLPSLVAAITPALIVFFIRRMENIPGYQEGYWNFIRGMFLLSPAIATFIWAINTSNNIRECTILIERKK